MLRGLIIGKFYPFHIGHEYLISQALKSCDMLSVLVCCSTLELIPQSMRVNWLQQTYHAQPKIEIIGMTYDESLLPNTSESSREVSKIWAKEISKLAPDVNLIISGEDYGSFVADFLNIRHLKIERIPEVSGSIIRSDALSHWDCLNIHSKADLVKKIVLLGTESTGKSTMTKCLAERFDTQYVEEAGRNIVPHTEKCSISDLYKIARDHAAKIQQKLPASRRFLFIDTNILITNSYCNFLFGRSLDVDSTIFDINRADLYLYLDADAPYIQDGTRLSEERRNSLDRYHRDYLDLSCIDYHILSGNWEQKTKRAVELVEQLKPFA